MRARNIKPGFFDNEDLAEIDMAGRVLFIGLWLMADREGRLEERVRRIKAKLFPFDNIRIDVFLKQLHDKGFIIRYQVNGLDYIQIINFKKHQNPHINERKSTIPEPDLHYTCTILAPKENGTAPAESLLLNPESLSTEAPDPSGTETVGFFETFWKAYPKKVGKLDAQRAWKKNKHPDIFKILEVIEKQKTSREWTEEKGRFIPNPATWINQGRWDDEPGTETIQTGARFHREAEPLKRDEKLWLGPVPEDFKKVFEKIGRTEK